MRFNEEEKKVHFYFSEDSQIDRPYTSFELDQESYEKLKSSVKNILLNK
jgi:hypothetical protein